MTEAELMKRYKNCNIQKGSLKAGKGKHEGKKTVVCKCGACGHLTTVATSDLWLKYCSNAKCLEKLNQPKKRGRKATT